MQKKKNKKKRKEKSDLSIGLRHSFAQKVLKIKTILIMYTLWVFFKTFIFWGWKTIFCRKIEKNTNIELIILPRQIQFSKNYSFTFNNYPYTDHKAMASFSSKLLFVTTTQEIKQERLNLRYKGAMRLSFYIQSLLHMTEYFRIDPGGGEG